MKKHDGPVYTWRRLLANWTSTIGLVLAGFGLAAAVLLLVFDLFARQSNQYLGIFAFLVAPSVMGLGLVLVFVGAAVKRYRLRHSAGDQRFLPVIDLNNRRHYTRFVVALVSAMLFLCLTGIGSYRAYHFTESPEFCGLTCHKVMKPEHVAMQGSPHANVACVSCHIGPGAEWYVKSKVNGIKQVWNTAFNKYPRPIATPIHNLRPASETCHTCHWPEKFFGSVAMQRTYFRSDETNTPWTIQLLIKVGGGDRVHGRAQGIHWHMAIDKEIEYIAADEHRLEIPWVRTRDAEGKPVIYRTKDSKKQLSEEQVAKAEVRRMDCMDCHNRPAHQYHSPERALNEALASGLLDPAIPRLKKTGIALMTGDYKTEAEGLAAIQAGLEKEYRDDPRLKATVTAMQRVFAQSVFPEMQVSWRKYPDHIGHMITPGCFRCHDGQHVTDDGRMITKDCDSCHTILAQGPGTAIKTLTSTGLKFEHPEDIGDEWQTQNCSECHQGVPVM